MEKLKINDFYKAIWAALFLSRRIAMDIGSLKKIRDHEINVVIPFVYPGQRVLEIGAGAGWQSKKLEECGAIVSAIDVEGGSCLHHRIFPVAIYDGQKLPFRADSFDMVFSSNTLEHISDLEKFQAEIYRVLRQNGIAIHIVPSASWRCWTTFVYYVHCAKYIIKMSYRRICENNCSTKYGDAITGEIDHIQLRKMIYYLYPHRHGSRGNVFTEMYLFSKWGWRSLFLKTGWEIRLTSPNRLFYTGYQIMGDKMSLKIRAMLSYLLGSSCHVFVLGTKIKEQG